MPRSSRTLDMSLTRVASQSVSTMWSASASRRSLRSSMNSISSSQLSRGLSPRLCASASATSRSSSSHSFPSSSTFFSPSNLLSLRECLAWELRAAFLSRSFVRYMLRLALTLKRTFSEIPAISSRVVRASFLHVSSTSHARSYSCNSSSTTGADATMAELGGEGAGGSLHKANTDKPTTNQGTRTSIARND
jgi:hypothetical protein